MHRVIKRNKEQAMMWLVMVVILIQHAESKVRFLPLLSSEKQAYIGCPNTVYAH